MPEEKVYRIGEVAAALDLKTSVLRFWESEFPELVPKRSAKGHRCYDEKDVELLKRIKQLLHEQGMTIEGAKRILTGGDDPFETDARQKRTDSGADRAFLNEILQELNEVREQLVGGTE